MEQNALLVRIDRLESIEEIRQLAGKYALSLDMRDLDAHVNLFAEDIRVGREKTGRAHLKAVQHGAAVNLDQNIVEHELSGIHMKGPRQGRGRRSLGIREIRRAHLQHGLAGQEFQRRRVRRGFGLDEHL